MCSWSIETIAVLEEIAKHLQASVEAGKEQEVYRPKKSRSSCSSTPDQRTRTTLRVYCRAIPVHQVTVRTRRSERWTAGDGKLLKPAKCGGHELVKKE